MDPTRDPADQTDQQADQASMPARRIPEPVRTCIPVIQHEEGALGRWMRLVLLHVAAHDGRFAQLSVPVRDEEEGGQPVALPLLRRWTALGYAHRLGQGASPGHVLLTLWQREQGEPA